MDLRRVQETGGGTLLISLPKNWAQRCGLKRGSVVAVIKGKDGHLTVVPQYKIGKRVKRAVVFPSFHMVRELTGKYLLGDDLIEIKSRTRLPSNIRRQIRGAARRLVGLEIIEEGPNKMLLQCLLEPSSFPPDRILHREHLLSFGMHKDAVASFLKANRYLAEEVIERDEEVDRLYFLIVRVLRTAVLNPLLSEKIGLSLIDCLDYRLAASFIESMGDQAVKIAQSVIKFSKNYISEVLLDHISRLNDLSYEIREKASQAFFSKSLRGIEDFLEKNAVVKELGENLEKELAKQDQNVISYVSSVASSLLRICDYSFDLVDLVMP